jgi:hypothetical protein
VVTTTKEPANGSLESGKGEDCNQRSDLTDAAEGVTGHVRNKSAALSRSRVEGYSHYSSKIHPSSAANPRLFQRDWSNGEIVCPSSKKQMHTFLIHNSPSGTSAGLSGNRSRIWAERLKSCSPAQFEPSQQDNPGMKKELQAFVHDEPN